VTIREQGRVTSVTVDSETVTVGYAWTTRQGQGMAVYPRATFKDLPRVGDWVCLLDMDDQEAA
jgi:hypothetical protein